MHFRERVVNLLVEIIITILLANRDTLFTFLFTFILRSCTLLLECLHSMIFCYGGSRTVNIACVLPR